MTAKFRNEDESKQFQSRSRINIPLISTPLNTALKFSLTEMFETEKKQLTSNHTGNLLKFEAYQAVKNDAKSVNECLAKNELEESSIIDNYLIITE